MTGLFENLLEKLMVSLVSISTLVGTAPVPSQEPPTPTPPIVETVAEIKTSEPQQASGALIEPVTPHEITPPIPVITNFIDRPSASNYVKDRLVNIYCTFESSGPDKPLTGTGVVIDSRGTVLTNAHVGQFFILRDFAQEGQVDCVLRTGSPAIARYEAEPLYISPEWVEDHADDIFLRNPVGTGEGDYALLHITKPVEGTSNLPEEFPYFYLDLDEEELEEDAPILIGSYPAGILDSLSVRHVLFAHTFKTTIKEILTFGDNVPDVISTGGSFLAQRGSSGGAVLNKEGKLIGLMVTSTQQDNRDERDLRAISLRHIDRSLREYSGTSLKKLLSGDPESIADDFNKDVSPLLADLIFKGLVKRENEND